MSDETTIMEELPQALVEEDKRGFSFIWLVPLVALIVGLVFVYKDYSNRGPTIKITFSSAEGIEPKNTVIKYRDVVIGRVKSVRFSDGLSHVVVTATLTKDMDALLSDNTRFWVVRPRIGATGASGIETLFSGAYIAIDPGKGGGYRDEFIGMEEPPKVLSDARGSFFRLRAAELDSIAIGSPVYHRDIEVGEVTGYRLLPDEDYVLINIFVNSPYDRLVHENTRFWNVSGVKMNVSGEGVEVQMESLVALLAGGVAFETRESLESNAEAPRGMLFPLYESRQKSQQQVIHLSVPYVLYFDESVRGLSVGAPVEYRGIRVGSVQDVSLQRSAEGDLRIAVLIGLEPERVPLPRSAHNDALAAQQKQFDHLLQQLVAHGLRAQLATGNLLTGQLIVDLSVFDSAPPAQIDYSGAYPELPTRAGTLAGMLQRVAAVLEKLEQIPFDQIGADAAQTMQGLNRIVNDSEIQTVVKHLADVLAQANTLLDFVNQKTDSTAAGIGQLAADAGAMIRQAQQTFKAFETTTSAQGVLSVELERTLRSVSDAARSISNVAEYLERHPEALLQGKGR